jgi:adenine-specific DNA-methyltransferase
MDIPNIATKQGLTEYAESLADLYSTKFKINKRRTKGQVFTPQSIALFMSKLFNFNKKTLSILDPGAGTGILTAAVCESLLKSKHKTDNVTFELYESDPNILPYLKKTVNAAKNLLEINGHTANFTIISKDYIMHNETFFNDVLHPERIKSYDLIISNPPYFKLNANSIHSKAMKTLVSGQPNIYSFFMALATKMLNKNGQMVFITPRSFCSGLYYNKFRKWFLDNISLEHIHIFESRKANFIKDNILQENIIIKAINANHLQNEKVTVSNSTDAGFSDYTEFSATKEAIIFKQNGDIIIRIPSSVADLDLISNIDKWKNTLNKLGFQVSTGPVVTFRATQYLSDKSKKSTVPLLWMHNLSNSAVNLDKTKSNKPNAVKLNEETLSILIPVKNYVLLNRFSSKEQKRRLFASILLKSKFPFQYVGIENHLNYIHKPKDNMSVDEAYGIMALFKSATLDKYFRLLNGNTQVNASDIRLIPFPTIEIITEIGKKCRQSYTTNYDNIVEKVLNIKYSGAA